MKLHACIYIVLLILCSEWARAQWSNPATPDTTGGVRIDKLSIGALVDAYYGSMAAAPKSDNVPYFVSSARNNEWSINLAYIDVRYTNDRIRARIIPAFGSFMEANYAAESLGFRNLLEANAGIRLSKIKDIWLDVGILSSPYTNESAVSKDHLMYTRSLAPEYVPYYLAGAKLTWPLHSKVTLNIMLLNGWQEINDRNTSKSVGTQLEYRWNNKNLLNWNTYIGNERSPDRSTFGNRYFTDVYWVHQSAKAWSWTTCAYVGRQELLLPSSTSHAGWWQINAIVKRQLFGDWSVAARAEFFSDPQAIQVVPLNPTEQSFEVWSSSIGLAYRAGEHGLLRVEGRYFESASAIFPKSDQGFRNRLWWINTSVCVWF